MHLCGRGCTRARVWCWVMGRKFDAKGYSVCFGAWCAVRLRISRRPWKHQGVCGMSGGRGCAPNKFDDEPMDVRVLFVQSFVPHRVTQRTSFWIGILATNTEPGLASFGTFTPYTFPSSLTFKTVRQMSECDRIHQGVGNVKVVCVTTTQR